MSYVVYSRVPLVWSPCGPYDDAMLFVRYQCPPSWENPQNPSDIPLKHLDFFQYKSAE